MTAITNIHIDPHAITTAATASDRLAGRTAVVTGAGSGIGAATARALHTAGARVALVGRRAEPLESLAAELENAVALPADITDLAHIESVRQTVGERLGVVDIVVANAGAMLAAPVDEADPEEWRRMIDVNIGGLLSTARAFLPDLLTSGEDLRQSDLVLISSIGAHLVLPGYAVYMATKAAVTHLAHGLQKDLGGRGIRVHNIEPGMTASDLGSDMAHGESRAALHEFATVFPPMPAEAIAEGIVWSCALPAGVNAAELVILPTAQGFGT